MSEPLQHTQLDAELARIAGLSGDAQRQAAIALVEQQSAPLGGTRGMHAHAIHGRALTLLVVRDGEGELQVQSVRRVEVGRWTC